MQRYFTRHLEDASKVVLTIKSGICDINTVSLDASPAFLRRKVMMTNQILAGTNIIDLFGPGRIKKNVLVEVTVKALGEFATEGLLSGIQLTEVNDGTIRRVSAVAKIDMVGKEINLWATQVFDNSVADICAELGIVIVAHTPLSSGILTRKVKSIEELAVPKCYRHLAGFQSENLRKNFDLISALENLTVAKGCTTAQLALTWIKLESWKPGRPLIITVSGASSVKRALENAKDVDLTDEDMKEVDAILISFTEWLMF